MKLDQARGPAGTISYSLQKGGGGELLFLHADLGRSFQWDAVRQIISGSFTTAALDFRGHGASEPASDGDYSFEARAADVDAVLDHLCWNNPTLIAHSGGCAVALAFAALHPRKLAGMMLVEPPTDPRAIPDAVRAEIISMLAGENRLDGLKSYYASIAGPNEDTRQAVLRDVEATSSDAQAGVVDALANWNPEPTLMGYRGRMHMVIAAANDTQAALCRVRPDIPYETIADTGHWPQMDRPDAVAQATGRFAEHAV